VKKKRDIDPNFIAGMSTGNKQNHPYNFSYGGDEGMPEEKEYRYSFIYTYIYIYA
jgi:hypothetical protein